MLFERRRRKPCSLTPSVVMDGFRGGCFVHPHPSATPVRWNDSNAEFRLWWSDPRMVLDVQAARERRRYGKDFEILIDVHFDAILYQCAQRPRHTSARSSSAWITEGLASVYSALHRQGLAHSFGAFERRNDSCSDLVGGLIVIGENGAYSVETMFHSRSNASKACLDALIKHLKNAGVALLDFEFPAMHFEQVGGVLITAQEYKERLDRALDMRVDAFDEAGQSPAEFFDGRAVLFDAGRALRLDPLH